MAVEGRRRFRLERAAARRSCLTVAGLFSTAPRLLGANLRRKQRGLRHPGDRAWLGWKKRDCGMERKVSSAVRRTES